MLLGFSMHQVDSWPSEAAGHVLTVPIRLPWRNQTESCFVQLNKQIISTNLLVLFFLSSPLEHFHCTIAKS